MNKNSNRNVNIVNYNFSIFEPKEKKSRAPRIIFSIIALVFSILLIFCVYKKVISGTSLSFSSFLNYLSNSSVPSFNTNIGDFTIYGNWGLFDGFRLFLNIFTGFFGILVFVGSNILNLLFFVMYIASFLFA